MPESRRGTKVTVTTLNRGGTIPLPTTAAFRVINREVVLGTYPVVCAGAKPVTANALTGTVITVLICGVKVVSMRFAVIGTSTSLPPNCGENRVSVKAVRGAVIFSFSVGTKLAVVRLTGPGITRRLTTGVKAVRVRPLTGTVSFSARLGAKAVIVRFVTPGVTRVPLLITGAKVLIVRDAVVTVALSCSCGAKLVVVSARVDGTRLSPVRIDGANVARERLAAGTVRKLRTEAIGANVANVSARVVDGTTTRN